MQKIVLTLLFISSLNAFTQEPTNQELKKELTDKCKQFLVHSTHASVDSSYNLDNLKSVTSPTLFRFFELVQEINSYSSFNTELKYDSLIEVINYSDKWICKVNNEAEDYNLYFTKIANEYVVDNYANESFKRNIWKSLNNE